MQLLFDNVWTRQSLIEKIKLTKPAFWDDYWGEISLPLEIKKSSDSLYINEIMNVFNKYFEFNQNLSIIEIGGSPGQFLAYMHRNFGYKVSCLDYSEIGCMKTEENFKLLNIPATIYQRDLFS